MDLPLDSPDLAPLAASLRHYDRRATLPLIAGLFTIPDLHPFTLRLEVLAHLAARHCRGRKVPRLADLNRWLGDLLPRSGYTRYEDPPPDVFVGNVMGPFGNHLLLQGTWIGNDIWLQEVIDAVYGCGQPCADAVQPVFALLRLGTALCERAGLVRWQGAPEQKAADFRLHSGHRVSERARYCLFMPGDLARLRLTPTDLEPFVLPDRQTATSAADGLERTPLVRAGDGLILALPTAVSVALRRYVLATLAHAGSLQTFEARLRNQQVDRVGFHLRSPLRADLLPPGFIAPRPPAGLPPLGLHAGRFDNDKYFVAVILHGDLDALIQHGMDAFSEPDDEAVAALEGFTVDVVERLLRFPHCRAGLVVTVSGGLGGSFAMRQPRLPAGWEQMFIGYSEFLHLIEAEDASLLRWWKLLRHKRVLAESGVRFFPGTDVGDLYAACAEYGYRLIPEDCPYPGNGYIVIDLDFARRFKTRRRQRHDQHCVQLPSGRFLRVARYHARAFWKRLESLPVYASFDLPIHGKLYGVIETPAGATWICHEGRYDDRDLTDLAYRIWDAFLFWLHPLLLALEQTIAEHRHPPRQIVFTLEGPWAPDDVQESLQTGGVILPRTTVNPEQSSVSMHLSPPFLAQFHRPENLAERLLLEAVVRGLATLRGPDTVVDAQALVADLMRGGDARQVHAFTPHHRHFLLSTIDPRKYRTLQQEDTARVWLGLASATGLGDADSPPRGVQACNAFLHRAVDVLVDAIGNELRAIDRRSIVELAYSNVEGLDQASFNWQYTSRAIAALYGHDGEAVTVASDEDEKRIHAKMAGRILVEMAVCSAPVEGGRPAAASDLDDLLARIDVLLRVAGMSEFVHDGLAEPVLEIHPNGEFVLPRVFIAEVMEQYRASLFGDQFHRAAGEYDGYYEPPESDENSPSDRFPSDLVLAFTDEYGLTPGQAIEAMNQLLDFAIEREQSVVTATVGELRGRLVEQAGLSGNEAQAFLNSFALWPRPRWDRPPKGYTKRDILPWHYKRRLSLAYRPLVRLGTDDAAPVVYGAMLLTHAISYLFNRLQSAELPQEFFHTDAMRTYQAARTDALGHAFNERVAQALRDLGWTCRIEVQMTTFGAAQTYGDMDVIAWREGDSRLLLIESKRLQPVRNANEAGNLYREFKGEGRDRLDKALQRWRWAGENLPTVLRGLALAGRALRPVELLVTSADVPLRYLPELPFATERIVPLVHLPRWLADGTAV